MIPHIMHIRFRSCKGLAILEEGSDLLLGVIVGILIHPDTGKVEGFFVHSHVVPGEDELFCSTDDLLRWGTRVYVRDADALGPAHDRVRLQERLEDRRTILGQQIRTESGFRIGRCKDVQINTDSMHIEWLFPRKWFRWGTPLAISDVIEVKESAIIVRDPLRKETVEEEQPNVEAIVPLPEIKPG